MFDNLNKVAACYSFSRTLITTVSGSVQQLVAADPRRWSLSVVTPSTLNVNVSPGVLTLVSLSPSGLPLPTGLTTFNFHDYPGCIGLAWYYYSLSSGSKLEVWEQAWLR